jgi:transcriptional regulator with XRE-family HTH domain
MISPEKCKAARALLGWSQDNLAQAAHLGLSTIKLYEAGNHLSTRESSITLIITAFERAGISFLDNGVILDDK